MVSTLSGLLTEIRRKILLKLLITYGSYITLTHLINYKRFSLDSRILACGAKSAEQLTIGQD